MTTYDQHLGQRPPAAPRPVAPTPVPAAPGYQSAFAAPEPAAPDDEIRPNAIVHPTGAPARSFIVKTVNVDHGTATVRNNNGCGCGGTFTYRLDELVVDGYV